MIATMTMVLVIVLTTMAAILKVTMMMIIPLLNICDNKEVTDNDDCENDYYDGGCVEGDYDYSGDGDDEKRDGNCGVDGDDGGGVDGDDGGDDDDGGGGDASAADDDGDGGFGNDDACNDYGYN